MILKILLLLNFLLFSQSSNVCIHLLKYNSPTDVRAFCNDTNFIVDTKKHVVEWGSFTEIFEDKYPYFYQNDGSLLIKAVSDSSTHFMCEVKDRITKKSLHKCGTSVIIFKPLILTSTPINETVERGSLYKINCHGGGGDYNDWKLMYFVNDIQDNKGQAFPINYDTKIECRLVSGNETLSSIAYIKVKRDGILTDEEKLLEKKCALFSHGICYENFPEKSYRIYSSYKSSRIIIEQLLNGLFQLLDKQIIAEYNEDKCIDRFKRLVCATLYTPCQEKVDNSFVEKRVCRESCETTLHTVCRNTVQRIKNIFINYLAQFNVDGDKIENQVVRNYKIQYISKVLDLAKSVFDCQLLQSFRNKTKIEKCSLLNLDAITGPGYEVEKSSSKCYNKVGRNFTGEVSHTGGSSKCIEWSRIPQLFIAFYQQNLQNHSSHCRNPGAIFSWPVCPITTIKTDGNLNLNEITFIPCTTIYSCDFLQLIKKSAIDKGSIGTIIIIVLVLLALFTAALVIYGLRCSEKKFKPLKKKIIHADDISLNDDQTQLFHNKVYMYKNVQNGHYSCPIYNSACLERVYKLSDGAYGEILLVQAVFEDSTPMIVDETTFSTADKGTYGKKSFCEFEDNGMDDFILSKDKTFNGKPCWPFDKSSTSGCCPFAVIKFSIRSSDRAIESRFSQETKVLSLLNHPNIIRFYGVTVNSTGKIISRIIEYLPNGTLHSILTGDRLKPIAIENHDRNKVENGYQKMSAIQKSRIKENSNSISTLEFKSLKRKKTISSHSKELEPPKRTENIDLAPKQLIKWIVEICDAVLYLHSKHFLHRDIATRNCLVGLSLETKLSDFNFLQKFTIGHDLIGNNHEFIPIRWLPKETLDQLLFNIDTDVWMFGVFMWEVMSLGKQPYGDLDLNETCDAIMSGVLLEIPHNCQKNIYEQMEMCWKEPNSRPCLETIKKNLQKISETL